MTGPLPVPVDVLELVLGLLRPRLAERPEPVLAGLKVSSETGHGREGGPPSLPWLRVTEEGHTWAWPAVQRVVLRLTCWHRTEYNAKAGEVAEPYRILVVADFPANFSETAARRLLSIASSGPSCGVFTLGNGEAEILEVTGLPPAPALDSRPLPAASRKGTGA